MRTPRIVPLVALLSLARAASAAAEPPPQAWPRSGPLPGPDEPRCSFLVYGDNRSGDDVFAAVVEAMGAERDVDFVLSLGDSVVHGQDPGLWDTFLDLGKPLFERLPLLPVLGNHELALDPALGWQSYRRHMRWPGDPEVAWYAFDCGPVRFLVLDTNDAWDEGGPQDSWLDAQLRESAGRPTIVAMHHGVYSSGMHGDHPLLAERRVGPRLLAAGVALVLSGHDHIYERGSEGGLRYVVSGGGGSPLYTLNRRRGSQLAFSPEYHFLRIDVRGDEVRMVARRPDRSVLEDCRLVAGGGFRCGDGRAHGPRRGDGPVVYALKQPRVWVALFLAALIAGALHLGWRRRWRARTRRRDTAREID